MSVEFLDESQNSLIPVKQTTVKATFYVTTDVEGRSLGEREGLDTLVVQGENYKCHRLAKVSL
jgi:hypothetical protein